jgi:hypothetical protein
MERYCSTSQSPQRAVVPTDDEEEEEEEEEKCTARQVQTIYMFVAFFAMLSWNSPWNAIPSRSLYLGQPSCGIILECES